MYVCACFVYSIIQLNIAVGGNIKYTLVISPEIICIYLPSTEDAFEVGLINEFFWDFVDFDRVSDDITAIGHALGESGVTECNDATRQFLSEHGTLPLREMTIQDLQRLRNRYEIVRETPPIRSHYINT